MISIIIPTYNSIAKMPATLASLRALDGVVPHEVVFIDDCSNDGTYEAVLEESASERSWTVHRLEVNSGSAAAPRNEGIRHASGEYLFFLDSDDEILPDGLKAAYEFAEKYESDAVRSTIVSVRPDGSETKVDAVPRWDSIKDRTSRLRAIVRYQSLTCSFLMRRAIVQDNDITFDEFRRIGEDITFTARVLSKCEKIAYRDLPIRKYLKTGQSEESVTQKIRDSDFREFFESWEDVEATLDGSGISFMKEHGRAALLYALRQYVWFKTEDITPETFAAFSDFLNRHWATISEYQIESRYLPVVEAARDGNREAFTSNTRLRLLVVGHDLKFIKILEPFFRRHFDLEYDKWGSHTAHDEVRSEYLLGWADYVWVEWLLGASVWYSQRVRSDQRLIVRTHRSEMTADYGLQIDQSNVHKFIAIAPHCLGDFSDRFDIPRSKFALIPNPFDVDSYQKIDNDDARFRIGMVGIVPTLKGFHRAVELIARLREEDDRYQLHVYGKQPEAYSWVMASERARMYYESCRTMIAERGLESAIVEEGWVDTRKNLKNVGFVVSLSDYEGMQVAPGEAFCAGGQGLFRPWRGVEYCYPDEFIFEDTEAMAEHILSMRDRDAFEETSARGESFIRENYALPIVEGEVMNLLLAVRG